MNPSSFSAIVSRLPRGLTLMEVMISLGLIAVALALFFPAAAQMREVSENARCIGRLRSLGVAIKAYTGENDGYMPSGWSPAEGTIVRALERYVGPMKGPNMAADTFYCPANERLGSPPAEGYDRGGVHRYKGFAGYFMGYLINASVHPIKGLPEPGQPEPKYRLRQVEVKRPGRTVALLDLPTRPPTVTAPPSSGLASAAYFNPTHQNFALGRVHQKRGNILFVDGHVESFDGSVPLPVQSLPDRDTTWYP